MKLSNRIHYYIFNCGICELRPLGLCMMADYRGNQYGSGAELGFFSLTISLMFFLILLQPHSVFLFVCLFGSAQNLFASY